MAHYASAATDAMHKIGVNRITHLIDNENKLFAVIDGLVDTKASEYMAGKMLDSIKKVFHAHRKILEQYSRDPSYYNRVRAGMLVELAYAQLKRRIVHARQKGMEIPIVPEITIMLLLGNNALIANGTSSGVYHIRDGKVTLITAPTSDSSAIRSITEIADNPSASSRGSKKIPKTRLTYCETRPGDIFLMASDGLMEFVASDSRLPALGAAGSIDDAVNEIVNSAHTRSRGGLITGLLIKVLAGSRDPYTKHAKKLAAMKKLPLFAAMDDHDILRLMGKMKLIDFKEGDRVKIEGDADARLYCRISGRFAVTSEGKSIGVMGRNGTVADVGLLNSLPRNGMLVAATRGSMLVMPREIFRDIRNNEPELATRLLWAITRILAGEARSKTESEIERETKVQRADKLGGDEINMQVDESTARYTYFDKNQVKKGSGDTII